MPLHVDGFTDVIPLAGGGFGSVYKATRASTGGVVALKVLDRAAGADDDLLERRLRREIAALVALKGHPNVVQVEQVVTTEHGPAIVMEFMSRGSVLETDDPGATPGSRVAFIGAAVAAGLHAAHDVGIVHRDVKPQNVLVNNFGQVKLCDFGIAAIQRSAEFQTRTTALSVRYASPEELDNDPGIGSPTDVYSLGASMFHLLYGEPPSFRGGRGADPSLTRRQHGDDVAAGHVGGVVERCLSEDPARRPTADECFELLSEVAESGARRTTLRAESPTTAPRDRPVRDNEDITAERSDGQPRRSSEPGPNQQSISPAPRHQPPPPSPQPPPPNPPANPQPNPGPPNVRPDDSGRPKSLPSTSNERWW
jgi:serine/threonine protein kinase